ncbi:type A von Willebrand factor domain-containing protein [Tieghemostelium lacteum]|uniref:Type A von Willebrand factor domain-containing protein n=1 Tax=Tieghemostelium lacteum TaxID=361077 RepID=A0A151Z9A4_TIELA|nr:type A von Willebrand factor domain-containing protein [Tieghemostelium lacteum]|eukprot:KYQ90516.1 type A von Willebrand factor domain-containing protein [Tieghemostelium lacteum]
MTVRRFSIEESNFYTYYNRIDKHKPTSGIHLVNDKNDKSFALSNLNIDVKISDCSTVTTLEYHFINKLVNSVECVFSLPLPQFSCISGMEIQYDGELHRGCIKEKEKAQDRYSDAIASGNQSFLVEEVSDQGVHQISLGNIPPGKDVIIRIRIASEIFMEKDGSLYYFLHCLQFPQGNFQFQFTLDVNSSVPLDFVKRVKEHDISFFHENTKCGKCNQFPIVGNRYQCQQCTDYNLCIECFELHKKENNFHFSKSIDTINEQPHTFLLFQNNKEVVYRNDRKQAQLKFNSYLNSGFDDNHFLVEIKPVHHENGPSSSIEYNPATQSFGVGLNFYPQFNNLGSEFLEQKSEYIFLLDCSGSMDGQPIKNVASAMEIILRSLNENQKFQIIKFGTSHNLLFPDGPQLYSDETLKIASDMISNLNADLGGTNLLTPLEMIFKQTYDPIYPRQIFILTDGAVNKKLTLVEIVRQNYFSTRVFTLGIGNDVDDDLVKSLSLVSRGKYKIITNIENLEMEVMEFLSASMEPTISNIRIDWNGLKVLQPMNYSRPVFNGERFTGYGIINSNDISEQSLKGHIVTFNAILPTGQEISYPITIDFTDASMSKDNYIHSICAYKCIKHLQDQKPEDPLQLELLKNEIIKISKLYEISSKYTSFIVINVSSTPTAETMKQIIIPEYTSKDRSIRKSIFDDSRRLRKDSFSRNFLRDVSHDSRRRDDSNVSIRKSMRDDHSIKKRNIKCERGGGGGRGGNSYSTFDIARAENTRVDNNNNNIKNNTQTDPLMKILKLQKANGSWTNETKSFKIQEKPDILPVNLTNVWVTLVILFHLEKEYSYKSELTSVLTKKAWKWIDNELSKHNLLNIKNELVNLARETTTILLV